MYAGIYVADKVIKFLLTTIPTTEWSKK